MAAKKKKDSMSTGSKVGIGVGLTAAAVAAAGAYFLYGSKESKDNRKKVKSWMLKAKAEVLETIEDAEQMTQGEYDKLVDSVSSAYGRLKTASKADVATFKREMKEHWGGIEQAGKVVSSMAASMAATKKPAKKKPAKKAAKKSTKKTPKKTTKKTAKKATKKTAKNK